MLVGLSGPATLCNPGDMYECDESEAARLIGARFAVPWDEVERAVESPVVETRSKRKKKG